MNTVAKILLLSIVLFFSGCAIFNPPDSPNLPDAPNSPPVITNSPPVITNSPPVITNSPPVITFVQSSGQQLTLDGKPWKMILDTAWLITEQLGGYSNNLVNYLSTRKSQGFNTILMGAGGDWFDKDVNKPIESVLVKFDAVINAIEGRNMFIIPCIQMHQYKNGLPILVLPKNQAYAFGQYFAKRYGEKRCIPFWMIGGLDDKGVVSNQDIMNQALGVRSIDSKHLLTFHPRAGFTTLDAFPVGTNHQLVLYQTFRENAHGFNRGMNPVNFPLFLLYMLHLKKQENKRRNFVVFSCII